ncbi:serine hydrolase domain-containing protein [Salmonirosea aquatica]|uniref:Serine hydrolase n=1 Tax=Salmonirosea aquatica TaxID=2654236 RepID=A0A7C9BCM6_9BACT|nr:serine hydrolase [Cytophagaceae bacterium SJW1-29]
MTLFLKSALFISFLIFACILGFQESCAQSDSLAVKIDHYIQDRLNTSSLPGLAIAVVRKDSIVLVKGYGTTDGKRITADTPFAIASLSKAFTALAILQLVEKGAVDLDAPVNRYLPSFVIDDPRGTSITIRQLLHQTSGLADTGFPELAFAEQPHTLDQAVERLKTARLVSAPGEQFHYHNPNYQVLAKVVEAVSQEEFSDYLRKHWFVPLGMSHTQNVALTHLFYAAPDGLPRGNIFAFGKAIPIQEPQWFVNGAAGMISTANDMAHWLQLQLNEGVINNRPLISRQSVALSHSLPSNPASTYAMGWYANDNKDLYHSGILWTYSAEQILLTESGYGIVLLFNGGLNPFVDYYSFIHDIAELTAHEVPPVSRWPDWVFQACLLGILVVGLGLSIRRIIRKRSGKHKFRHYPAWRSWFGVIGRLWPLFLLLLIPFIITALSKRVLNWERIFLMMPDVILLLGALALSNSILSIIQTIDFIKIRQVKKESQN